MATVRMIRPNYVIQFFIGKLDMTMRVEDVVIINSIKTVYPIILIKLNFSSKDYFLEKIYGQEDAKLLITLTGEQTEPTETTDIDLIIVHMNNKVSMQKNTGEDNETSQVDDTITLVALMKKPYIAFSSTVNFIFSESNEKNDQTNEAESIREELNSITPALSVGESIVPQLDSALNSALGNVTNEFGNLTNGVGQLVDGVGNVIDTATGVVNNTSNLINNATNLLGDASILLNNTSDLINNFTNKPLNFINEFSGILNDGLSELNRYRNLAETMSSRYDLLQNFLVDMGGFGSVEVGNFSKKILSDQVKKLKAKTKNLGRQATKTAKKNTPAYVVNTLFDKYIKDIDKNLDFENLNNIELKELVIPPRSLIGCIRYINDRYGIYKGPLMVYAGIDNQLDMWDISRASEREILYTVDFLAAGQNDSEIFSKSMDGDSNFYTYKPLKIKNSTNTNIMNKGFDHIVVKRPRNKFVEMSRKTLDDASQLFKTIQDPNLIFNKNAIKNNIAVHTNVNASSNEEDPDEAYLTSKMMSYIASCSTFTFNLEGTKLPLQKLSKVGACIELIPHVTEYLQYGGKYVVGSSAIKLSRTSENNYKCYAEVTCFRESLESQPDTDTNTGFRISGSTTINSTSPSESREDLRNTINGDGSETTNIVEILTSPTIQT